MQQQVQKDYQHSSFPTLAFGLTAILLTLPIAWLTLLKIQLKPILIQEQIVELEQSREALHQEATHDQLTSQANRRQFIWPIQQAIRLANRYGGKPGILYVDLDYFKTINDTLASIRDSDTVARLGGDEFGVFLESIQGREDVLAASHKIEQELNEETDFYGFDLEITASIAHALYPDDGEHEDALIRVADAAMYRVKSLAANQSARRTSTLMRLEPSV